MGQNKPIGLPYASHARKNDGTIDPAAVVCPICKDKVSLNTKKDNDSYALTEYQNHFESKHKLRLVK